MPECPQSTPFLKRRDQQSAAGTEKGAKHFGLGASRVQGGRRLGRQGKCGPASAEARRRV